MNQDLAFHHVGCVVPNLREAVDAYRFLGRPVTEPIRIASQKVAVCFVELAPGSHIELVEPLDGNSVVSGLLKKQATFYHLGFLARDFDAALRTLDSQNFRLLGVFASEAFAMRRCAFLVSPAAHLIEIIEAADSGASSGANL